MSSEITMDVPIPTNMDREDVKAAIMELRNHPIGASVFISRHANMAHQYANKIIGPGRYAIRTEEGGCRVWLTREPQSLPYSML